MYVGEVCAVGSGEKVYPYVQTLQAMENHFLVKQTRHKYWEKTDTCAREGLCACVFARGPLTGRACIQGAAAFHLPTEAWLGSPVMFSRLLDGISIHIWLYNFHNEGVLFPCDSLTLLLTPLHTQIQFHFPTLCPFRKGQHSVCLFLFFSSKHAARENAPNKQLSG